MGNEKRDKGCHPGCGGQCLLVNFDRPFFHKNDTLKQKRAAGSKRVGRNLKCTKGIRSARLGIRSFEEWEEEKAGGWLIRNLCQRVKYVHAGVVYMNANGTH
jgi:hypothetical protein